MANQYSTGNGADFTTANNWDDSASACPGAAGSGVTAPAVTDTFYICDTHTVTLAAPATVGEVIVGAGGTLALGAFPLTATTRLFIGDQPSSTGGTVTSGATTVHQLAMLSVGSDPFSGSAVSANLGDANITGAVNLNNGTLTLGSNSKVGGNLGTAPTTTFVGTLRFTAGNKTIGPGSAGYTIPNLNLSLMATGDTITIAGGGPAGRTVIFTNVAGGSLTCDGTPYAGTALALTTVCTVTVAAGGGGGAISAPMFSIEEKPTIYSEEVK